MNRTLLSTISAAVLALSLAVPSLAQVQLAEELANKLAELGIDQTLVVSEDQALQIENVLNTADSDEEKTQQINTILGQ